MEFHFRIKNLQLSPTTFLAKKLIFRESKRRDLKHKKREGGNNKALKLQKRLKQQKEIQNERGKLIQAKTWRGK